MAEPPSPPRAPEPQPGGELRVPRPPFGARIAAAGDRRIHPRASARPFPRGRFGLEVGFEFLPPGRGPRTDPRPPGASGADLAQPGTPAGARGLRSRPRHHGTAFRRAPGPAGLRSAVRMAARTFLHGIVPPRALPSRSRARGPGRGAAVEKSRSLCRAASPRPRVLLPQARRDDRTGPESVSGRADLSSPGESGRPSGVRMEILRRSQGRRRARGGPALSPVDDRRARRRGIRPVDGILVPATARPVPRLPG